MTFNIYRWLWRSCGGHQQWRHSTSWRWVEEKSVLSPHWIPTWSILDPGMGTAQEGSHNGDANFKKWTMNQTEFCLLQIVKKAVYSSIASNLTRRTYMERLHIYPGSEIPEDVKQNLSGQIRPIRPVPKPLQEYSEEEIQTYPKLFDYPKDYVLRWMPDVPVVVY